MRFVHNGELVEEWHADTLTADLYSNGVIVGSRTLTPSEAERLTTSAPPKTADDRLAEVKAVLAEAATIDAPVLAEAVIDLLARAADAIGD